MIRIERKKQNEYKQYFFLSEFQSKHTSNGENSNFVSLLFSRTTPIGFVFVKLSDYLNKW